MLLIVKMKLPLHNLMKKVTIPIRLINTAEDMMAEPLKINPDFLLMHGQTNDECNLYTSPLIKRQITHKGAEVENLVIVGDNKVGP